MEQGIEQGSIGQRQAQAWELISVYDPEIEAEAEGVLYAMLARRPAIANISHRKMPSFEEHRKYVSAVPYFFWRLIRDPVTKEWMGQVYLTKVNEIGIQILPEFQRRGIARAVIQAVTLMHKGPFRANINPNNRRSIALFRGLGFDLVQSTYELNPQQGTQEPPGDEQATDPAVYRTARLGAMRPVIVKAGGTDE